MTEEQKKAFVEWLDKVIVLTKSLRETVHINIEGLDKYAGTMIVNNEVHLNNTAFEYAVESLNPTVIEKVIVYADKSKNIERSFDYKGMNIFALFNLED